MVAYTKKAADTPSEQKLSCAPDHGYYYFTDPYCGSKYSGI